MRANENSTKQVLRERAEKLLIETSSPPLNTEQSDVQKLIHELQVHQIELEMQNDELRRTQLDLEESRTKYSDLYDFAPAGYFTFSSSGEILDVNLTGARLLGVERTKLLRRPFSDFVAPESRSLFCDHRLNLLRTGAKERGDLELIGRDGKPFYASLESISMRDGQNFTIRSVIADITELKKAQEKAESEHAFRIALENSILSGIAAVDLEGKQSYVNLGFCRMVGWSKEELLGKKLPFAYWPPEESDRITEVFKTLTKEDAPRKGVQLPFVNKIGERFDVLLLSSPLKDCKGKIIGWVGTYGDITHFKQMEAELKQLNMQLEERVCQRTAELEKANQQLRQEIANREKIEEFLRQSEERFRVAQDLSPDGFTILRPVRDGEGSIVDFTWIYENAAIARMNGTDPNAVIGRRLLDLFPGHDGSPFFEAYRQVAETSQPQVREALYHGETIRVPTWFRVVVVPMGQDIAVLGEDITERKRAEEELKRSEEKYRDLIKFAPAGIYEVDFRVPRFTSVNDVLCHYLGYSREELLQMNPSDIMDGKNASLFQERMRRQLNGEKVDGSVEYKVRAKDGREYYATLNITFTYENGEPKGAMVVAHDITERKEMEEKIVKSEARLRALFGSLDEGVIFLDPQGKVVEANNSVQRFDGRAVSELTDSEFQSLRRTFIRSDGSPMPVEEQPGIVALRTGEAVHNIELGVPWPDGKIHWRLVNAQPVEDKNGTLMGAVISFFDITERKRAEEELRASQTLLRAIMESTPDSVYVKDKESRIIMGNPALAKLAQKPLEEIIGKSDSEFCGDLAIGQALREHDLAVMNSGKSEVTEEIIRTPDGYRTFLSAKTPYRNEFGEIIGITGISRDITDRKLAEEALKKARDEMEKQVQARTSELSEVIERLCAENTQRRMLEETLRESEKNVRFFASQCLTAQETERKRIAGELHDGIAASLGALKMRIEKSAEEIKEGHGRPELMQDLSFQVMQISNDVRRIMADLRPGILDDLGIIAALNWFCREYQKTYLHISVEKQVEISEHKLPESLKTPIFRVTQEAMTNIAKHSKANLVNLSLRKEDDRIVLKLQDNGIGFDVETVRRGMGLSTMRERVQLSGGSFELESVVGKGTTIQAEWTV